MTLPDPINDRARLVDLEIEQAFLGTVLAEPEVFGKVENLSPDVFTDAFYAEVWRAMKAIRAEDAGAVLAPSAVARRLNVSDVKQAQAAVGTMVSVAGVPMQATDFARQLTDLSSRRGLWRRAEDMMAAAADLGTPVDAAVAEILASVQGEMAKSWRQPISKRQTLRDIAADLRTELPCYSTGLPGLDKSLGGGLYASRMIGIGARMKAGKTTLAGTISDNLNDRGINHLFMCHEMSNREVEQRSAAKALGINSIRFLTRDDPTLAERIDQLAETSPNHTLYENMQGADLDDVTASIGRAVVRIGVRGVILDYLQLVEGQRKGDTEEQHLRRVAQTLANMAKREGIFVLILCQLNQDGNVRGGEGLKLACDGFFKLHRHQKDKAHSSAGAWLEHELSRYTLVRDVGDEDVPGLTLSPHGPCFVDPTDHGEDETPAAAQAAFTI